MGKMLIEVTTCDEHPAEGPCFVRGVIVLTEAGPQFAYHNGLMMAGPAMPCGFEGCGNVVSVRVVGSEERQPDGRRKVAIINDVVGRKRYKYDKLRVARELAKELAAEEWVLVWIHGEFIGVKQAGPVALAIKPPKAPDGEEEFKELTTQAAYLCRGIASCEGLFPIPEGWEVRAATVERVKV